MNKSAWSYSMHEVHQIRIHLISISAAVSHSVRFELNGHHLDMIFYKYIYLFIIHISL